MRVVKSSRSSLSGCCGRCRATWAAAQVAVALTACGGCGQAPQLDRVAVEGTVQVDGAPLEKGSITLLPVESTRGPRVGAVIESGRFRLTDQTGPVAGQYRVEILADQQVAVEEPEVARQLPGGKLPPNPIDEQFNTRSTLTATISPEMEPLSFVVERRK